MEIPLRTTKQGVYLVILFNSKWASGFRLYVGSSYGEQGLKHRVFENHGSTTHRNLPDRRGKYLYELMAETGTTWHFVGLAVFEEKVPKQLVLVTEAIMCSLFFTYRLKIYQKFRPSTLPFVDSSVAVNRSDPLAPEKLLFTTQRQEGQHRTLANALAGGPQNISMRRNGNSAPTSYLFNVFDINFYLPKQLGIDWSLSSSPYVDVTFDISPIRHEFPFAILCDDVDDGNHLGISISKVVKGTRYQWWLELRTMEGIRTANSLVDWLDEKIADPATYEWTWDRRPFFGPRSIVRFGPKVERWEQRVEAARPGLAQLIASRKRKPYSEIGADIIPLEINHGTKRKYGEMDDEEEEEEEEKKEEEPEPTAYDIWVEQVQMTRKYLTANHKQMREQGVDLPYFETYRTYRC